MKLRPPGSSIFFSIPSILNFLVQVSFVTKVIGTGLLLG